MLLGSFEFVYKGVLYTDNRAKSLYFHGASKSFIAEYEALRNIKHQNFVRLMHQRSLEEWLHDLHPPPVIEESFY
ncbi:LRR receptor-like serine/threonine-protein kinase [Pyrus ussuriensis x Pyrus communis]|uniref:LRR receptor-like serine/threonine-protein kinase n=1 Tax=Pyrus ussuriensis x Pyrus communis TaxID=2448454 RepID=A0A5N5HTP7_9ROSA|nr:LRR receptor-like serine/threonine-protein kinase [Pyrus ussuriensis x Pyrus communis]